MADVLILSLVFRPDNVSTAQLMADLAEDLQRLGHSVSVVTSMPHYNPDPEAEAEQPLASKWFGLLKESRYEGIRVLHAWMPRKGTNKLYRMATWAMFHLISTLAAMFPNRRPQIILCPSPPPTIALSAWLLGLWHRAPFVYIVQEIYPDVAINLGMIRNKTLIRICFAVERFIYRKAAGISVISKRMLEKVADKGVARDKLVLIPNFVDVTDFRPLEKENSFSREHGLGGKFLVSYAGNFGKPQHLEVLVQAASRLRERSGIHFLVMGHGSEEGMLRQMVHDLNLLNVTLLGYQPYEIMPQAYAASDASYVPQAIGTSADGIPSKVYRIMASGCPVIASTDVDSDLATMVAGANCGCVLTAHDPVALANAIEKAAADPVTWRQLGRNGRLHVLDFYERNRVAQQYEMLVKKLASTG